MKSISLKAQRKNHKNDYWQFSSDVVDCLNHKLIAKIKDETMFHTKMRNIANAASMIFRPTQNKNR